NTGFAFLPPAAYSFPGAPRPQGWNIIPNYDVGAQYNYSNFCAGSTYPNLPDLSLNVHIRVRFILVDMGVKPYRIVDYVNLMSTDSITNLTRMLIGDSRCMTNDATINAMWCTNRVDGSTSIRVPTTGIENQIYASLNPNAPGVQWND